MLIARLIHFNLHSRVGEIANRSLSDFCVAQMKSHARTRTTLHKVARSRNRRSRSEHNKKNKLPDHNYARVNAPFFMFVFGNVVDQWRGDVFWTKGGEL